MNFVRLIRVSLSMLISGSIGLNELSGPVGIVSTMNQVAEGQAFGAALSNIAYNRRACAVNLPS